MATKTGKKFCVEHAQLQQSETNDGVDEERVVCPYDPKHTCYLKKMKKHLKICNSRCKVHPPYIVMGINLKDSEDVECVDVTYPLSLVSDNELLELIMKIEKVYATEKLQDCETSFLSHEIMAASLSNPELQMNTKKHFIQNSSLIKNMEANGLLREKTSFIEFGAGRGHLGFWITQAVGNNENCSWILIDKASPRHKSDNKLKGLSSVNTMRLRADIADVELAKVSVLTESKNTIVGVTKHLCGSATDLALRCIIRGKMMGLNVIGIVMAFCCHHQCSWTTFVGKKFLLDFGFTPRQFSALCSISSWATCGSGKPRKREEKNENEDLNKFVNYDRYKRYGLSQEIREDIGRKTKMILNQARLKYLVDCGFKCTLLNYVERSVSPENVCIIAKTES